jgi:uncharacterized protein (TIGR02679 family)
MPGPRLVIDAVRQRAQRGFQTEAGTLNLPLTTDQRREVARLLGTPWEVSGRPVRLQDLAATLTPHGLTVRGLVEAVDGRPVDDHGLIRAQSEAAAEAEYRQAAELLTAAGVPVAVAAGWLREPGLPRAGTGALRDVTGQVCVVWRRLPGGDGTAVRLAQLAAESVNDSHALDARQPLGRAVARLAAAVHGLERPLRAGYAWRQAWASVGVRCDTVSSRVLVLNLPLYGQSPAVRLCAAARGEPLWLTQRLLAGGWSAPAGTTVFVCENPTVVEAAADALAVDCPPLVCTDGIASGAALDLVAGLATAGCYVAVRADFDDAGITVVDQIRSVAPAARLWRYNRDVYSASLGEDPVAARGDAPDTVGDVATTLALLRTAYRERSTPVHEERILDELLRDLGYR